MNDDLGRLSVEVRHAGRGVRWAKFSIPVAVDSDGVISVAGICLRPPVEGQKVREYRYAEAATATAYHSVHAQTATAEPSIHWVELELAVPDPDPEGAALQAAKQLAQAELNMQLRQESLDRSRREVAALRALIEGAGGEGAALLARPCLGYDAGLQARGGDRQISQPGERTPQPCAAGRLPGQPRHRHSPGDGHPPPGVDRADGGPGGPNSDRDGASPRLERVQPVAAPVAGWIT